MPMSPKEFVKTVVVSGFPGVLMHCTMKRGDQEILIDGNEITELTKTRKQLEENPPPWILCLILFLRE